MADHVLERKLLNPSVKKLLASVTLATVVASAASSQELNCVCTGPAGSVATLTRANGAVLVSSVAGFEPAEVGSTLPGGSRVILGRNASATIKLGTTCSIDLDENTEANVATTQQEQCIALSRSETPPQSAFAGGDGFTVGAPEYLFLGSAAGALLLSVFDEDKAVSD